MSSEALAWAFRADLTGKLTEGQRLVLLVLADHANAQDGMAWPSRATMADRLGVTVRTVSRHLARLERSGLIVRADQRVVAHYPAHRRPIVWQLRMGGRARPAAIEAEPDPLPELAPAEAETVHRGDSPVTPKVIHRGDRRGTNGVTALSPKPKTEQQLQTPVGPTPRAQGTNPRAQGTNPRAQGTNPQAQGTNPRAQGTNPRAQGTTPRARATCPSCGQPRPSCACSAVGQVADPATIARIRAEARAAIAAKAADDTTTEGETP